MSEKPAGFDEMEDLVTSLGEMTDKGHYYDAMAAAQTAICSQLFAMNVYLKNIAENLEELDRTLDQIRKNTA